MSDRRAPFDLVDEKKTLLQFLDYLRDSVILKAGGLDEEAVRRPLVPTGTSLLWLIKHLTMAEVAWFHYSFAGLDVEIPSSDLDPGEGPDSVIATYRAITQRSNEIVDGCNDLDRLCATRFPAPRPMSLRWVLVHMVEETARHAGHADILREQIDGQTGR